MEGGGSGRADCVRLASRGLNGIVGVLSTLVAAEKLGPVDRLGFAMDRVVAAEALAEALRVYNSLMRSAERLRVMIRRKRKEGEKEVEEEVEREFACCEVLEEGEYTACPGVEGVALNGRYAGRRVCCIVCVEPPSGDEVSRASWCIASAPEEEWRLFTRILAARAYSSAVNPAWER